MSIEKVLVVDDDSSIREFVAATLRRLHIDVEIADNGEKALKSIKKNNFDLILTDMKMPDMTGIDLLKQVKKISPNSLVVVITGYGSVENSVEAMRNGAFNYLIKPFSPDIIEAIIEKAIEHQLLVHENAYLRKEISTTGRRGERKVIANSQVMKDILNDVQKVAKSNANIFITGESGTGKEVISSEIHYHSLRADHPYIKVNCAAIPETLIESEFFGHEKGAFTGAHSKKLGRFELANEGTILLDEITEVPIVLQAKLLRVIQEQEFERIGGTKSKKVDVRIVSTSNRNISQAIEEKVLREDLFYRLNVVPIHLPPLRERSEDIIPLAEFFIEKFCSDSHFGKKTLTDSAKEKLLTYSWPGNVRELANIIERSVVMGREEKVGADSIYFGTHHEINTKSKPQQKSNKKIQLPIGITLKELEKRLIIETLNAQDNNRTKTANILDISVRTLRNKLKEYHMENGT
ncbi:MAG: sigma-54 dependent transcriptional regulator [Chlamydiota bacterium]|nr:sigma-54 dependent transcriptional regulator [Chlamydiota bacterium]